MNSGFIAGYDAIKKLDRIYLALLQELLTTIYTIGTLNWCQQFRSPPCANLLHAHVIVHDLMDDGFWNGQLFSQATDRDLPITHYDLFYGFNVSSAVIVDGQPIRGASSKACSGFLSSATHLATVWYDGAESL